MMRVCAKPRQTWLAAVGLALAIFSTTVHATEQQQALQRFWSEANCQGTVVVAVSQTPLSDTRKCVPSRCSSNADFASAVSSDVVCLDQSTSSSTSEISAVLTKNQVYAEVDYYESADVSCSGEVNHRLYSVISAVADPPCLSLPGTTRSGIASCDEDGHATLNIFFSAEAQCRGKSMLMDLSHCKQPVGFATVILTPSDVKGRCFVASSSANADEPKSILNMLGSLFGKAFGIGGNAGDSVNNDLLKRQRLIAAAAHAAVQHDSDVAVEGGHRLLEDISAGAVVMVRSGEGNIFEKRVVVEDAVSTATSTTSPEPTAKPTSFPGPLPFFGYENNGTPGPLPAVTPSPSGVPVLFDVPGYRTCFAWDEVNGAVSGKIAVAYNSMEFCCTQTGFLTDIVSNDTTSAECNTNNCLRNNVYDSFIFANTIPGNGDDCLLKCYQPGTGGPSGTGENPPPAYVDTDPQVYEGPRLTDQNIFINNADVRRSVSKRDATGLSSTAKDAYILDESGAVPLFQAGYAVQDSIHNFACIHKGTIASDGAAPPDTCQIPGCGSPIDITIGFLYTSTSGGSTCFAGCYYFYPSS